MGGAELVFYRLLTVAAVGVATLVTLGVWGAVAYAVVWGVARLRYVWRIRSGRSIRIRDLSPDLQARIYAALAWERREGGY